MATKRKAKAKAKAKARPTIRRKASAGKKPAVRKALARRPKSQVKPRAKASATGALRYAGVGNEAVLRATGKAWEEWLKVLDRAGAKTMPHKDIALMLSRQFAVPDWWSQMVTVGYEQARGLREAYQNAEGYSANASKTVAAALNQLYDAWNDPALRARWMPDAPVEVRRSNDGKSMTMAWTIGDSRVDVGFFDKGQGKSMVQVEHAKLKDSAAVMRQKEYWQDALGRMQAFLEAVTTPPKPNP
jgi:uncharacterized protein YndB with AHSA1/START domain